MLRFWKYHALGNDYLVLDVAPDALTPEHVRRICDRYRGVGADGVLVRAPGDGFRVRVFNPDGSEAEKSGNGLRIFARWLSDWGEVGKKPFVVQTLGGPVICHVLDRVRLKIEI